MGEEKNPAKELYFHSMRETWAETRDYMLGKLSEIEERDAELAGAIAKNPVVEKRLKEGRPKMRPFLMKLVFEACGGGDWGKVIPACAAVEFLNISTYVANAVLDEKAGRKKKGDVNRYLIVAMLFRDIATECLLETRVSLSPEETRDVVRLLEEINRVIYEGQFIDLFRLKKEKMKELGSFEEMKKLYLERCGKLCGYFMKNVAGIACLLANATGEQKKALREYGMALGTAIQVCNDLGDFTFPEDKTMDYEKDYQDMYSDIKHGKLTLPTILGLESGRRNPVKELLGRKRARGERLVALTEYLAVSEAVEKVREECKKHYYICKKELKKLPESEARTMLSIMASAARSNKYFVFFRKLKEEINQKTDL